MIEAIISIVFSVTIFILGFLGGKKSSEKSNSDFAVTVNDINNSTSGIIKAGAKRIKDLFYGARVRGSGSGGNSGDGKNDKRGG